MPPHLKVYDLGGRTIYVDWEILGFLEEIDVFPSSDPVEEYAKHLMDITTRGVGCDQESLTDSCVNTSTM